MDDPYRSGRRSTKSATVLLLSPRQCVRDHVIHAPGSLAVACYACILPHIKQGTFLLWPIAGAFFFWLLLLFSAFLPIAGGKMAMQWLNFTFPGRRCCGMELWSISTFKNCCFVKPLIAHRLQRLPRPLWPILNSSVAFSFCIVSIYFVRISCFLAEGNPGKGRPFTTLYMFSIHAVQVYTPLR